MRGGGRLGFGVCGRGGGGGGGWLDLRTSRFRVLARQGFRISCCFSFCSVSSCTLSGFVRERGGGGVMGL